MWSSIKKMLGLDPNERALEKYREVVEQINDLASEVEAMNDEELRALGARLKTRAMEGEAPDDLLPEVFAVVREAS